jgi:hypothetical protein
MQVLADTILLIHASVVAFIVGGAFYIWIGVWRDWVGIRSPLFRYVHIGAMLFVAAETVMGLVCPLTLWEQELRGEQSDTGFVADWVGRMIYYNLPGWVFSIAYVAFAGALIVTLILVPPGKAGTRRITSTHSSPPGNS